MMDLKRELSGMFKQNSVGLEQQFRGFDANGDGVISHDEFRQGLASLGAQITEQQVDDLIKLKFGRLVTSENNKQYISNAILGKIFGVSAS